MLFLSMFMLAGLILADIFCESESSLKSAAMETDATITLRLETKTLSDEGFVGVCLACLNWDYLLHFASAFHWSPSTTDKARLAEG